MTALPYDERLHGAWIAIQEIKTQPDPEFWELFDGIWVELRDGLQNGEDPDAALEALVAYTFQAGHGDLGGFV